MTLHPMPRRLPTPYYEPPYDDETDAPYRDRESAEHNAAQGTLALAFVLPSGLPALPEPPPLRLVQPTALPDPRAWASRFVRAVLEVLDRDRPVAQLIRWTTTGVLADLQRRVAAGAQSGAPLAGRGRVLVRSVRVSEPTEGVVEISVVVQRGPRVAAIALRLDALDGRWRCSALELN